MCSNFSTSLPFIYLCQRKFIYTYIYPGIYTYLVGRNMGWNVVCFLWVIPRRLKFICRSFGTLCLFHLHGQVDASSSFYSHLPAYEDGTDRVSETSAYWIQTPGNHPKKAYNIQNTAKAWNQEWVEIFTLVIPFCLYITQSSYYTPPTQIFVVRIKV